MNHILRGAAAKSQVRPPNQLTLSSHQPTCSARRQRHHLSTMASMDAVTERLGSVSITPAATLKHATQTSPASWREAITASGSAPAAFELTKTLVFKPKTARSAAPVPVVVIAREETETSSAALGKKLNLKELRLASADLLTEFFALDKDSCEWNASICY